MGAIITHYQEDDTEKTVVGNNVYESHEELKFTPDADSVYFIIASWFWKALNDGSTSRTKFNRTSGTAKDFNVVESSPMNTGTLGLDQYFSGMALGIDSFGASPSEQTYQIQARRLSDSYNMYSKYRRIFAIKKDTADQYAESEAVSSWTTNNAWQTKVTLSFTPETDGDYMIMAVADRRIAHDSITGGTRVGIDGSYYGEQKFRSQGSLHYQNYAFIKKVTLTGGVSHSITLQHRQESGTVGTYIRNARLVAIRLDRFKSFEYAEDETLQQTTSGTYQDLRTVTKSLSSNNHLVVATMLAGHTRIDTRVRARLIEGANVKGESDFGVKEVNMRWCVGFMFRKAYGSSETIKNQHNSQYPYNDNIFVNNLIVIELANNGGAVGGSGLFYGQDA